jgi:hypothetical protein
MRSHTPARAQRMKRVCTLLLAIPLLKIMPAGAAAQYPMHTVYELAVVRRRSSHMLHTTRKRSPDPLHCASLNSYRLATSLLQQASPATQSLYVDTA